MKGRWSWAREVSVLCLLGAALLVLGCGSSRHEGEPNGGAGSGSAGGGLAGSAAGTAGTVGGASAAGAGGGSACQGTACVSGGASSMAGSSSAAQACRDYFTTVCARIRACDAPTFRPCESPADACPDILFSEGSGWTVPQVLACTEEWKTHDCGALMTDKWPACSQVPGSRPLGGKCVFDAQCQQGQCVGGIVPTYQASCGVCADIAASHGVCDDQHVCPPGERCEAGACSDLPVVTSILCTDDKPCPGDLGCYRGVCMPASLGAECSWGFSCAAGLACGIELGPDPPPQSGTCQPLPAIGERCLPTFGSEGLCAEGGTCNARPSGECVPLVAIGEACGFTRCVAGAYCQIWGYSAPPSHVCYARGNEGEACPHEGVDHGDAACAEGLFCICPSAAACTSGVCGKPRSAGQSCNDTNELCAEPLGCSNGICVTVVQGGSGGTTPAGSPCERSTAFGRETATCMSGECLCPDAACTAPVCATARNSGETCDASSQLCRQGLTCAQGICAVVADRGLEAKSCMP